MSNRNLTRVILLLVAFGLTACDSSSIFVAGGSNPGGGNGNPSGPGGPVGGVSEPTVVFAPNHIFGYGAVQLAGDSGKLVFTDDSDTLGTNPDDDWQVWSLDLFSGALIQLTSFVQFEFDINSTIDISDNGDQVVFVSDSDIDGTNPNNLLSIFRVATDGSSVSQVFGNSLPGASLWEPNISGDGSTIVFLSASDLTGDNPALDIHLFAIDADGTNLRQVTTQVLLNLRSLSFADNGSKIAFQSLADPFGLNPDTDWEIFVIDIDGSNLTQITISIPTPGGGRSSEVPKLSDDGSVVVFASDADHSPGSNPDPNFEVYIAPTNGGAITQLTSSNDENVGLDQDLFVGGYEVSGDGSIVVFGTTANLTGGNANRDHTLFWVNTAGGTPVQLLRPGTIAEGVTLFRDAFMPAISNGGATISFVSVHNFTSVAQPGLDMIYTIERQ
ncbi:MAG: TolB family protein [Woeseiaceae bacterium]